MEGNSHKKKLPQKPLKCPVSASVFCVVCVCFCPFPIRWDLNMLEARIMDKVGVCPHLDVLMALVAHTVLDCGGAFRHTRYAQY